MTEVTMNPTLENDPERRPLQYWYEDGIPEIVTAGTFGVFAAWYAAILLLPDGAPVTTILRATFVLVVIGGIFASARVVRHAKRRVTYPRTGFVAYRRSRGHARRAIMVAGFILLVLVAFAAVGGTSFGVNISVLVCGIAAGVGLLVTALRYHVVRLRYVGAGVAAAGIVSAVLATNDELSFLIFFLAIACLFAVSGSMALRRYLRKTPRVHEPEESNDERSM
jgi:hypothetical protein